MADTYSIKQCLIDNPLTTIFILTWTVWIILGTTQSRRSATSSHLPSILRISFLFLLASLITRTKISNPQILNHLDLSASSNVLFLTAHPDDECMFFSPAILALRAEGANVYGLSLSIGELYLVMSFTFNVS
jgi:hypothetical protein